MHDLPMQVAALDTVVVGETQVPYPGRRQIEAGRRAQAPCAQHQHPRLLQPTLAGLAHLRQQQVARIAVVEIAVGGAGKRLHQRQRQLTPGHGAASDGAHIRVARIQQRLRRIGRALAALADQQDFLFQQRQVRGRVSQQLALRDTTRAFGHAAGPLMRLAHVDQHRAMGHARTRLFGGKLWNAHGRIIAQVASTRLDQDL